MKYRAWGGGGNLTYQSDGFAPVYYNQSQEVIAVLVKWVVTKVHITNIKIVWICSVMKFVAAVFVYITWWMLALLVLYPMAFKISALSLVIIQVCMSHTVEII